MGGSMSRRRLIPRRTRIRWIVAGATVMPWQRRSSACARGCVWGCRTGRSTRRGRCAASGHTTWPHTVVTPRPQRRRGQSAGRCRSARTTGAAPSQSAARWRATPRAPGAGPLSSCHGAQCASATRHRRSDASVCPDRSKTSAGCSAQPVASSVAGAARALAPAAVVKRGRWASPPPHNSPDRRAATRSGAPARQNWHSSRSSTVIRTEQSPGPVALSGHW